MTAPDDLPLAAQQPNPGAPFPTAQQPNLLYVLSQHLASHTRDVQLQGQQHAQSTGLPAVSAGLAQLTTGGILAAYGGMAGLIHAAPGSVSATNSPSLAHNNAAALFSIPQLCLNNSPHALGQHAAAGPPPGAAAFGPVHVAAGMMGQQLAGSSLQPAAGMPAASGVVGTSGQHSFLMGGGTSTFGRGPTSSAAAATATATAAAPAVVPGLQLAATGNLSTAHGKAFSVAAVPSRLQQASAPSSAAQPPASSSAANRPPGTAGACRVAGAHAAAGCQSAGTDAAPAAAAAPRADAAAHASRSADSAAAAAGAGSVTADSQLEACPTDLLPVVCGHLHGWYSSSEDQVLLMQQQHSGPGQQQLKNRLPPAAAPASAWVTRSGKGGVGSRCCWLCAGWAVCKACAPAQVAHVGQGAPLYVATTACHQTVLWRLVIPLQAL